MKSLEIVNSIVKILDYYMEETYSVEIGDLKIIKADLEVLEIIRKKRVYIDALIRIIRLSHEKSNEEILYDYNCLVNKIYKLTMEELLKLKKWLEVNE